jgi:hypothetical protein
MIRQGIALREIGPIFGLTYERVRQIGKQNGVYSVWRANKVVEMAARRKLVLRKRKERRQKAIDGLKLIKSGMSIRRAARKVGLSSSTLAFKAAMEGIESQHGPWKGKGLAVRWETTGSLKKLLSSKGRTKKKPLASSAISLVE